MSKTKNSTAAATRPRRYTNPKNGAKSAVNGHDSGFSSGSSAKNTVESTPEPRTHIQEAAYRLMDRTQRIQRGEPVDEDEFIVPSIEADDFEKEHHQENGYGIEGSANINLEESDGEEIVLTSIEPEDYGFESPGGSLKRKMDDSPTTDDDSDSSPQKKKSRGEHVPRGVNAVSRVTSGSVSDTHIKRVSSNEGYDFDEETTYYEDTAESEPASAELGDSEKTEKVLPKYDYVTQEDMKNPFHQAATDFLEEQIDKAVAYFHKLVDPEYPAYKAIVDLKVYRRRSWGIPNKEGRQLVKLLVNKD